MTPPLSVVIPSYCRADLLALCLRSVVRYAPHRTEIIVVDDASAEVAVSRTATSFPGVRAVRLSKRSGFCVAANTGVAAATAPVVELLNDDTEVTPGWADAALRWFADPTVGSVAPLVLQNDPVRRAIGQSLIDSAGDEYDYGGFARKRGHGQVWDAGSLPPVFSAPGPVWGASASSAFYSRDALLAVGGFPADFGSYFEDVDLSFRLRRGGFRTWYDPASVVWHRVSASFGRQPGRRVLELQSRNEERVFWRNVRGADRWRYLPRHAAVLAGKAARRLTDGTFGPWATGRARAWLGG